MNAITSKWSRHRRIVQHFGLPKKNPKPSELLDVLDQPYYNKEAVLAPSQ